MLYSSDSRLFQLSNIHLLPNLPLTHLPWVNLLGFSCLKWNFVCSLRSISISMSKWLVGILTSLIWQWILLIKTKSNTQAKNVKMSAFFKHSAYTKVIIKYCVYVYLFRRTWSFYWFIVFARDKKRILNELWNMLLHVFLKL